MRFHQVLKSRSSLLLTLKIVLATGLIAGGLIIAWTFFHQHSDENDPPLHTPATIIKSKPIDSVKRVKPI